MTTTVSSGQTMPGSCEHKAQIGCILTALPCCCSCADKRPHATAYPVYVDGQGIKMSGTRWRRYCHGCRDHWESSLQSQESSSTPPPDAMPTQPQFTRPFVPNENHPPPHSRPALRGSLSESAWANYEQMRHLQRAAIRRAENRTDNHRHPDLGHSGPTPRRNRIGQVLAPLGTREDVMQPDYESPLDNLFTRAFGRYDTAEEVRQAQREQQLRLLADQEQDAGHSGYVNPLHPFADTVNIPASEQTFTRPEQVPEHVAMDFGLNFHARHYGGAIDNVTHLRQSIRNIVTDIQQLGTSRGEYVGEDPDGPSLIDTQDRPPLKPESLVADIACKVCLEQRIDTIIEPCMHACMCHWCVRVWQTQGLAASATRSSRDIWRCPICRKGIKQYRRFHLC